METIDAIRINFNPEQLVLLNISLAFLMFGVALEIQFSDFKKIFSRPKIPIVGLISQLLLLPLLTLLLIYIFAPPPSVALGMILIAACPGGNVSNFAVHLAKANAALSVTLTSITTLSAVILTPLSFAFWSSFVEKTESLSNAIHVDPVAMVITIVQMVFIPLLIGMYMNHRFPVFVDKIKRNVKVASILIFFAIVVFAVIGNYDNIVNHIGKVFLIVLIHNTTAFIVGYSFASLNGLSTKNKRTIAIETGIQNSGLGLILIFNFFDGIGGMALITAWWGIWHLISGFVLATWWSKTASSSL